jgi:rod shape determining protein RodA
MVASSMILFAGVRPKPLIFLTILAIAGGFFAYHFLLHDYQQGRILTFFNPQRDPLGKGYHVIQSLIAVGSGRFWGKGFLAGSQSQLKFIPEQHTDFIFSVLAEEWGFVGCFFLLLLYFVLLIKCLDIAAKARDRFGAFMAVGIAAMFFWQIVVNLGGVLGLLPITGITLPFLSYGGSSIITLSIAVGILQNISMRRFIF